mgnify:CR=1 FL=1|jgi:ribonuclease D
MTADFQWIREPDALQARADAMAPEQPLFLDTEFMRERTFFPVLALVQVNDGAGNYLVDPLDEGMPQALAGLLAGRRWVMHSCSEDLQALRRDCSVTPDWVADTQVAAAFCGHDLQCGYQKMVKEVLGVDLPKDVTRSNWLQRPLSERQVDYAVQDVVHLPGLYQRLMDELQRLERLDWWQEDCQRLTADALHEADPDTLWQQVKGAGRLDRPEARARLLALAAWRDGCARARNLPRSFVIKDPELLQLAAEGARSAADLSRIGLHPSLLRRDGDALLELLASAERAEAPAPLPGPPDAAERAAVKRLRGKAAQIAAQLGVTPEIIARRRWLESMVRDPDTAPSAMRGWRYERVYQPLKEVL